MPIFIPFLLVGAGLAAIGTAVAASSSSSTTSNDAELHRAEKERRQRAAREDITAEAEKQLKSLFGMHADVISRNTSTSSSAYENGVGNLTFSNIQKASGFEITVYQWKLIEQLSTIRPGASYSQKWNENESKLLKLKSEIDVLEKIAEMIAKEEVVR